MQIIILRNSLLKITVVNDFCERVSKFKKKSCNFFTYGMELTSSTELKKKAAKSP